MDKKVLEISNETPLCQQLCVRALEGLHSTGDRIQCKIPASWGGEVRTEYYLPTFVPASYFPDSPAHAHFLSLAHLGLDTGTIPRLPPFSYPQTADPLEWDWTGKPEELSQHLFVVDPDSPELAFVKERLQFSLPQFLGCNVGTISTTAATLLLSL